MSRSLSRIRNIVSEIEEIHRKGQQGRRVMQEALPPLPSAAPPPVEVSVAPSPVIENANSNPDAKVIQNDGQVYLRLKGSVALNLEVEDSGESIQVKKLGNVLEILFEDGKAFHLPLKPVA